MAKTIRLLALTLALMLCCAPLALGEAEDSIYPLEDGGTLTVWCALPGIAANYITNLGENVAYQVLQEKTGVKLEFIHPAAGQDKESFNLMVASGEVPDIMVQSQYVGGDAGGVLDGVYADLTDLIPVYAPNYQHYLDTSEEFRKLSTTPEGRVYAMYNFKDMVEPFYIRAQFREDLLEKYEMRIPETLDEYEAFFEAVLNDPDVDMAPFTLSNDGISGSILCAWNIGVIQDRNGGDWYLVDDEVRYGLYAPEYKEYLQRMKSWYEKGYISKDFMTSDPISMFQTEKVAAMVGNGYEMAPACKELGIPITCGRYVKQQEGDQIHTLRKYWHNNGYNTYISGKADEATVAAALRLIDYGFTEEGILLWNFGPEGITWDEVDENGYPIYNENMLDNPKYPVVNAEAILKPHGGGWARYRLGDGVCMATNQKDYSAWEYRARWGDDPTVDTDYGIPPFTLSAEDDEAVAKIMNDVNTHAKEMTLKYITGAADFEKFDTEYTQVLQSFGIDEAIAIKQAGYNAYLAK